LFVKECMVAAGKRQIVWPICRRQRKNGWSALMGEEND